MVSEQKATWDNVILNAVIKVCDLFTFIKGQNLMIANNIRQKYVIFIAK